MSDSDFEEAPSSATALPPALKRQQTTQAPGAKRTPSSGALGKARPKPSKPASRPKPQATPRAAPLKQQQRPRSRVPAASDSEDDFLEGTLVQAAPAAPPGAGLSGHERLACNSGRQQRPLTRAALALAPAEPEAPPAAKAAGKAGGGKKRKRQVAAAPAGGGGGGKEGGTVTVWTLDAAADGRSAGQQQVTVYKLQAGQELTLGWGRPVAAYRPPQPLADVERPDRRVVTFPDAAALLAADLSSLGGGFQGVLINADLLESAAEEGGAAAAGVTTTQLAALQLDACVGSDGLLAVWAPKARLAEVAKLMQAWGFRYGENHTWVQLGPNGHVVQVRGRGGAGWCFHGGGKASSCQGKGGAAPPAAQAAQGAPVAAAP